MDSATLSAVWRTAPLCLLYDGQRYTVGPVTDNATCLLCDSATCRLYDGQALLNHFFNRHLQLDDIFEKTLQVLSTGKS